MGLSSLQSFEKSREKETREAEHNSQRDFLFYTNKAQNTFTEKVILLIFWTLEYRMIDRNN